LYCRSLPQLPGLPRKRCNLVLSPVMVLNRLYHIPDGRVCDNDLETAVVLQRGGSWQHRIWFGRMAALAKRRGAIPGGCRLCWCFSAWALFWFTPIGRHGRTLITPQARISRPSIHLKSLATPRMPCSAPNRRGIPVFFRSHPRYSSCGFRGCSALPAITTGALTTNLSGPILRLAPSASRASRTWANVPSR